MGAVEPGCRTATVTAAGCKGGWDDTIGNRSRWLDLDSRPLIQAQRGRVAQKLASADCSSG